MPLVGLSPWCFFHSLLFHLLVGPRLCCMRLVVGDQQIVRCWVPSQSAKLSVTGRFFARRSFFFEKLGGQDMKKRVRRPTGILDTASVPYILLRPGTPS